MEIEFERTEEDFVEFNLFHNSNSPSIKRQILWTQILLAITPFILGFVFYENASFVGYVIAAIIAIVFVFSYPFVYRSYAKWQIKRFLKEGNNNSMLGHNIVKLHPEGVFGESLAGESRINWSSIDNVRQNEKYIFIYIGISALIIPKRAFSSSAEQKEFVDYLTRHISQA